MLIATPGELGSKVFPHAVVPVGLVPEQKNVAGPWCTGQEVCLSNIDAFGVVGAAWVGIASISGTKKAVNVEIKDDLIAMIAVY